MSDSSIISVGDVVFRSDLYPRFQPDPARIQQYADCVDLLPPIEVNQHHELIDGYHRWSAHKKAGRDTITITVTATESDVELDRLGVQRNSTAGIQLSADEKAKKARQWFAAGVPEVQIASDMSTSARTLSRWLADAKKAQKADRDATIAELWLGCHTEEEIAAEVGVEPGTVHGLLPGDSLEMATWQKSRILAQYQEPDWTPPVQNIWRKQTKTNAVDHFGNSEAAWTDNLLYLYTEPFDIVVDPFSGGGATIDVCKRRLRRYWASDRKPIDGRFDVREYDIAAGPPPLHKRWQDVALLFLDPPYWRQAAGQYSDDAEDLANMPLDEFTDAASAFILNCAKKMRGGAKIALMIQPTQWRADDRKFTDHVFDITRAVVSDRLVVKTRISAPYSIEQYNAQMTAMARDSKELLVLTREIVVFEVTS